MITLGTFDTQLGITYSKHASLALGRNSWIVKKEFKYIIDGDPLKTVIVPKGFITDGASVPRLFWSLIPPWGSYGQAVVLHDFLIESRCYIDNGMRIMISRKEADLIFNDAMKELGVGNLIRSTMFCAVRCYGKLSSLLNKRVSYKKKQLLEGEILSVHQRTGVWI